MSKPTVILCEPTSKWASVLRRSLRATIALRETRSHVECAAALRAAPAAVLALGVEGQELPEALAFLERATREFPRVPLVVLADPCLRVHEPLVREAGATHVVYAVAQMASVLRLIERHVRALPAERPSLAAQVWDELPWASVSVT